MLLVSDLGSKGLDLRKGLNLQHAQWLFILLVMFTPGKVIQLTSLIARIGSVFPKVNDVNFDRSKCTNELFCILIKQKAMLLLLTVKTHPAKIDKQIKIQILHPCTAGIGCCLTGIMRFEPKHKTGFDLEINHFVRELPQEACVHLLSRGHIFKQIAQSW